MVGIIPVRRRALAASLLALGLLLSCTTVEQAPRPVPAFVQETPAVREIVYLSPGGDIRTVDRDGRGDEALVRVSSLGDVAAARFSMATWSPDASQIAFVATLRREGEAQNVESTLYVANPAKGSISAVHDAGAFPPFYLYWSPDSSQISFLTTDAETSALTLQIVEDSGDNYRVLGMGRPYYWDWSPAGDTIFAHVGGLNARGETGSSLRLLSLENGEVSSETLELETIAFQSPQYSPEGDYIAAAVEDFTGRRKLMLLDPRGEPIQSLATLRGQVAFAWSPDGRRIAYIDGIPAPYGGVAGRLHVEEIGASPQTISWRPFEQSLDAPAVAAFFWSPDGEKIAYFEPVVARGRNRRAQLIFRMKVYFVAEERTVTIGPFLPTSSFSGQIVPYFDQFGRSITVWSPDSEYIVINAMTREEQPGIYVVPANGDPAPRLIAEGSFPFWAPR
jgi:Tol biopolymer transport system component